MRNDSLLIFLFCLFLSCSYRDSKKQSIILSRKGLGDSHYLTDSVSEMKMSSEVIDSVWEKQSIALILKKMRERERLKEIEYNFIDSLVSINNNESITEELGYTLFEYLRKNDMSNTDLSLYLSKKDNNYREKLLIKMVQIMCIDLGEEHYRYNDFIKDFKIFENSSLVKSAFYDCMSNQVE